MKFAVGVETLVSQHRGWIEGRRIGLVSHVAARCTGGMTSAELLWNDADVNLVALFGPEHGFNINCGAGEECGHATHPAWKIPVHSLYGSTRRPTSSMLAGLDSVVIDLQDLGVRAYTYVSTMRNVLEACAGAGVEVIVADRPVPLPDTVDGPVTSRDSVSFVSFVDAPLSYGMTPGETAAWLKDRLNLDLLLRVSGMSGYARDYERGSDWPDWVPPSPAIRSWEIARVYPATVCFEALTAVHYGRGTANPFQIVGSEWMRGADVCAALDDLDLPGIGFSPVNYRHEGTDMSGVFISVTDVASYRPAQTAVAMISCLQDLYGVDTVWRDARCGFFDHLMGTRTVRESLLARQSHSLIAGLWTPDLAQFNATREKHLLYSRGVDTDSRGRE